MRVPLDIAGLGVVGQRTEDGVLVIEVGYTGPVAVCPFCGRPSAKVHDRRAQRKRDVPVREQRVRLVLWRRRFRCLWCVGARRRPRTFSEPNPACGIGPGGRARRTTTRLRAMLAQALPHQTVKRVAAVYGVGERFVRECFAEQAAAEVARARPPGETPRVLGLDEFSMKRSVRYETMCCDLECRQVLEVLAGRDGAAVQPYLEAFADPDHVAVVVIDMSERYRQVVELCLPRAQIVVDRFHAVQRVGQALDQVRLRLQRARGEERRGTIYRLRYALLRDPADWTETERTTLTALFAELPELQQAWQLKETFRAWYAAADRAAAEAQLAAWEQTIREQGLVEYQALFAPGSLLGSWRDQLLNYFDHPFTNGFVEGKNNRSKQLQRQAYGYRNRDNLRLRILLPAA